MSYLLRLNVKQKLCGSALFDTVYEYRHYRCNKLSVSNKSNMVNFTLSYILIDYLCLIIFVQMMLKVSTNHDANNLYSNCRQGKKVLKFIIGWLELFLNDFVQIIQHESCALHDAVHRIFGNDYGYAEFFGQKLVQSVQQSAPASQNHPAVDNVRR